LRRFDSRVAVVTGASRGIGLAIAARLVAEGARVCITARKPEVLDDAVRLLGGSDYAIGVPGKADDGGHQADAIRRTLEAFGRLDVLVNNAGTNVFYGPVMEIELAAVRMIFDVNVLGAIGWVQQAHRAWLGEHGGAIVNVASVAGLRPADGIGAARQQPREMRVP
jgi:NAD(P)-dependent dehydrogenase (short-subunit alcohol dehydrogenase family)